NTLLNRSTRYMHRIFDPGLLFLQFGLRRGTHFDNRHATNKLRQTFLEFFLIVVRGGVLNLCSELLNAPFDLRGLSSARDNGGVVLINRHFLGTTKLFDLHIFKLDAEIFADSLSARQNSNVFEHGFATVTEARSLNCDALQSAPKFVDNESREGFTLHVFRNNQQRFAHLRSLFEQRQQLSQRGDPLLVRQNEDVFQHALHTFGGRDEIRGEITAVELHAFDHLKRCFHRLGFLNGDDAVFTHLLHR